MYGVSFLYLTTHTESTAMMPDSTTAMTTAHTTLITKGDEYKGDCWMQVLVQLSLAVASVAIFTEEK